MPKGSGFTRSAPRIDPPASGPGIRFTNYFNLFRPEASRDGNVVAVVGRRLCMGGSGCGSVITLQTTITGLPGGTREVTGAGRLSGNGRYLLIYADGRLGGGYGHVVDLETGKELLPRTAFSVGFDTVGKGRAIADDGTAVSSSGAVLVLRGETVTELHAGQGSPLEAVIDAAGRTVVYSLFNWSTNRSSLRVYRITEGRDSPLAANGRAPYLGAGRRRDVPFRCFGLNQINTVNTDGSGLRQVSRDATGVLSAAMSDDGKVAWYFSGAATPLPDESGYR